MVIALQRPGSLCLQLEKGVRSAFLCTLFFPRSVTRGREPGCSPGRAGAPQSQRGSQARPPGGGAGCGMRAEGEVGGMREESAECAGGGRLRAEGCRVWGRDPPRSGLPAVPGSLLRGIAFSCGVCLLSGEFALVFRGGPAKCHPQQSCCRSSSPREVSGFLVNSGFIFYRGKNCSKL